MRARAHKHTHTHRSCMHARTHARTCKTHAVGMRSYAHAHIHAPSTHLSARRTQHACVAYAHAHIHALCCMRARVHTHTHAHAHARNALPLMSAAVHSSTGPVQSLQVSSAKDAPNPRSWTSESRKKALFAGPPLVAVSESRAIRLQNPPPRYDLPHQ
jgi:hypothetical protein